MAGHAVHAQHVRRPGKAGAARQRSLSRFSVDDCAGRALRMSKLRNLIAGGHYKIGKGEMKGAAAGLENTASCVVPDQHAMPCRARRFGANFRLPCLFYGNTTATFRVPSGAEDCERKTTSYSAAIPEATFRASSDAEDCRRKTAKFTTNCGSILVLPYGRRGRTHKSHFTARLRQHLELKPGKTEQNGSVAILIYQ